MLPRLGSPKGNAVFSPYSIQAALAMVGAGAEGKTAEQIGRVLHVAAPAELGASNATLASRLGTATAPPRGAPGVDLAKLEIANGLWTQSGLSLKPRFEQTLSEDFGASPQQVDFRSQPQAARQEINSWVSARTGRLIDDLMGPGSITPQTALVLADAVYLKARWVSPFNPSQTAPGSFFLAGGGRVSAEFMTQPPLQLAYAQTPCYQAPSLPYRDSTLSMLV